MEKDDEVSGGGNSYTTFFRQYDPRLGRWKSLDPKMAKLSHQSPFCGMDNNPIYLNDPMGDETGGGPEDPPKEVMKKPSTHIVKSGDMPSTIAKEYGITVWQLAYWNQYRSNDPNNTYFSTTNGKSYEEYWKADGKNWRLRPGDRINIQEPVETKLDAFYHPLESGGSMGGFTGYSANYTYNSKYHSTKIDATVLSGGYVFNFEKDAFQAKANGTILEATAMAKIETSDFSLQGTSKAQLLTGNAELTVGNFDNYEKKGYYHHVVAGVALVNLEAENSVTLGGVTFINRSGLTIGSAHGGVKAG